MLPVEIRVRGHIDERWSEWLDGLTITCMEEDQTVLAGCIMDQAALYGLISKLRDLGLQLTAVSTALEVFEGGQPLTLPRVDDAGACSPSRKRAPSLGNPGSRREPPA